jgi:zinc protease
LPFIRSAVVIFAVTFAAMTPAHSYDPVLKTLPNGLRYVILEDHVFPVVSLQIHVRCGGVNEEGPAAGVSHFLEHMIFKGTPRLSAGEISKIVESNGGSLNAATGSETTQYYVDMPSELFDRGFDVLSDSVVNPSFPPEEFEKERTVILEEIKRRNDDPSSSLWDGFLETIYRRTPYKNDVIGTEKTVGAMPRATMVEQHRKYYVPSNMVVVVAGDVTRARAEKRIKEFFGKLPKVAAPPPPPLFEPPAEEPVIKTIIRPAKQAHVALGFVGPTLDDPTQVGMDVLSAVLGGGQSTRLNQVLREEKRLVWNVGATFITHSGSGAFGIFAECPPDHARGLPNEVYLLLSSAESDGFSDGEVARAKAQLRSGWLFGQETYHGQASQWGFYAILGRPRLAVDYPKELDKVTALEVTELLRTYFDTRELSGAVVEPKNN